MPRGPDLYTPRTDILERQGVRVLDGTAVEVHGVGFAGGCGDRLLQPWGETVLKQFVHEAATLRNTAAELSGRTGMSSLTRPTQESGASIGRSTLGEEIPCRLIFYSV